MNYNHIKPETMTRYLAGELDNRQKHETENHLAVCPECAAKLDELRRLEKNVQTAFRAAPSGRLSEESRIAIGTEVQKENSPENNDTFWNTRIRKSALIQVGAVAAVGVFLILLTVFPKQGKDLPVQPEAETKQAAETETAVPAENVLPAEEESIRKAAEQTVLPEEEAAPVPETVRPEKKAPSLAQDPVLHRLFAPETIRLNPARRRKLLGIDSPFGKNVYIVFADFGEDITSTLLPAEKAEIVSSFHSFAGGTMLCAAIQSSEPLSTPAKIRMGKKNSDNTAYLPVNIQPREDFSGLDPDIRMSALLLAVCSKDLVQDGETRKKLLEEFGKLTAETEYGKDPALIELTKNLRRIK